MSDSTLSDPQISLFSVDHFRLAATLIYRLTGIAIMMVALFASGAHSAILLI